MIKKVKFLVGLLAVITFGWAGSTVAQTAAQKPKLTIEQLIDIKHPSEPIWSPDGKLVAFVWDRAGVANLYVANADGAYDRAIRAGAVSIEAPLDTPYGDRRGMIRDPFGNVFQIAHPIEAVRP